MGIIPTREALRLAQEKGLDLVEVAPQVSPPVCRIMDYGKYRYEQAKRGREARKKHRTTVLKEIKFRPNIGEHDYQVKLRHVQSFLKDGDKVKVSIMFRGREMQHQDIGRKILDRLAVDMGDLGKAEERVRMEARNMMLTFAPVKDKR